MQVQNHRIGSSSILARISLVGNFSFGRRLLFQALFLSLVAVSCFAGIKLVNAQSPVTYYVDCTDGNDVNSGTSASTAWKSMAKANKAALKPGDMLLFKRGCAWQGPLKAVWNGTAAQPIVIGAYGSGNLPIIQDSYGSNVQITGTYQTIEYIETLLSTPPNPDPNCNNQPVAWKLGFSFGTTASYNIVQYSKASKLAVGFHFGGNNHHNKILNNTITDNNVVWDLTANGTMGPAGVVLYGSHNEIAYNYFANNTQICTYNGLSGGISIELYGAKNSNIHHNRSFTDRVFSELGSNATLVAADNVYAYNLHVVGDIPSALGPRFLVTRGQGHSFGPVWRTKVYNNTIYHTGQGSKGVTCENCASDVLTVKNNIFWVNRTPIVSDGLFIEENNIFWSPDGSPAVGFTKSLSTIVADPGFTNAAANDFHLTSNSPAREAGSFESVTAGYTHDLDVITVPQLTLVDVGAYEAIGAASPSPTPSPTPSPIPSETPPSTPEPTPSPTPSPMPSPTPSLIAVCSISVNGGAIYTGDAALQVRANVPNAAQYMVGSDAGFTGATLQPYQEQFSWTLPDTGGRIATMLVYARFVDAGGTTLCGGAHLSDDIIYDPVPPTVSVAVTSLAAASAAHADGTSGAVISLSIDANDQENGSGVEGMQISLDGTFDDPSWQPYNPATVIDAGNSPTLYVRVRDGSGNISEAASVTIPGQTGLDFGVFLPHITH